MRASKNFLNRPNTLRRRHFLRRRNYGMCLFLLLIFTFPCLLSLGSNLATRSAVLAETLPTAESLLTEDVTDYTPLPETWEEVAPEIIEDSFEELPQRLSILLPLDPNALPQNTLKAIYYNPLYLNSMYDYTVSQLLYRPLDSSLTEGAYSLLESYECSEDGKSLTLTLKQDLSWEDAQPLTARDIYFSLGALLKPGIFYPFTAWTDKVLGLSLYRSQVALDGQAAASIPYPPISGIKCLNDYSIQLDFKQDIRPQLRLILSLPIVPAHVWWKFAAEQWLTLSFWEEQALVYPLTDEQGSDYGSNAEREYVGLGSGPYQIDAEADSPDLELVACPEYTHSPFLPAEIPRISIRHKAESAMFAGVLTDRPDLALLPYLTAEQARIIEESGYHLRQVPSPLVLSLSVNQDLADNPLLAENIQTAFYLLSPSIEQLSAITDIPVFASEEAFFRQDEHLQELRKQKQAMSEEERLEHALDLLMAEGYITGASSAEDIASKREAGESLSNLPPLQIVYPQGDMLCQEFVDIYLENLAQAQIYPQFYGTSEEELQAGSAATTSAHLIIQLQADFSVEQFNVPLFRQGYFFAYKRIQNFEPQNPHYFLGAETWSLP